MGRSLTSAVFGLFCIVFGALVQAATTVQVWTYYDSPPFAIDPQGDDLTSTLCRVLTEKSGGEWVFKPQYLPRKRINHYLESGAEQGLVLWANPLWFQDKEETKYAWSDRVVWGANEIVSLRESPVEYTGPESLEGKRFGGVAGHHYVGIDDLAQSGRIKREDTTSFSKNLDKLLSNRLDAILIPRGELFYMVSQGNLGDKLFISSKPHQQYERKILATQKLEAVRDFINAQLPALNEDAEWRALLDKYGLKP
ncbi:substrate-binding periplasmic protein [Hahella sp. NBU794]|uniref:substrate-binding periplasmic protein n=1 Tax=Hahella sp. NBU794 TaxID=3422590 RepID=UPI003D6ECB57